MPDATPTERSRPFGDTLRAPSQGRPNGRLRDGAALVAAFALPFLAYLRMLCPSPPIGDSTEFMLVFHFWGIPHATGYPLYILLGGLWDHLPIGTVAYRANLLSAVLAAGACAVVALVYLRLLAHRVAAVLAAYVTAFSSVFWSQAIIAEVYALHCLLVGLLLAAFLRWQRARSERSLVWLALAAGLALSHHRTALFVAAPLLLAALILHRPLRPALIAKGVLAALAPFLLYAYLPIRAQADPVVIWGDCRTWGGFRDYMTATAFSHFIFGRHGAELLAFYLGALKATAHAMAWPGIALGAAGWVWLWWRNRAFWICSTVAFLLTAIWAGGYSAVDAPVFMIANILFVGIWAAAGAHAAAVGVQALARQAKSRRAALARWVVPAALVLLPYNMVSANLRLTPDQVADLWGSRYAKHLLRLDMSDYWFIYDIGQVLLAEPGRDAILVLQGHGSYTIARYLQLIEGRRADLTVISRELAHHAYYRRRQRDPSLRGAMDEARRVFDTGIRGSDPDWGRIMLSVMVSRVGGTRPLFTNADTSLLPPDYHVLHGAELKEIVFGDPLARITRPAPASPGPEAPLDFGIAVAEARPLRSAREGAVAPVRVEWTCSEPIEFPLFVRLWMVNERAEEDWLQALQSGGADPRALEAFERAVFSVAQPFACGILPVAATAPGTRYEQTLYPVVPRRLAPGRYAVLASLETNEMSTAPRRIAAFALREEDAP